MIARRIRTSFLCLTTLVSLACFGNTGKEPPPRGVTVAVPIPGSPAETSLFFLSSRQPIRLLSTLLAFLIEKPHGSC